MLPDRCCRERRTKHPTRRRLDRHPFFRAMAQLPLLKTCRPSASTQPNSLLFSIAYSSSPIVKFSKDDLSREFTKRHERFVSIKLVDWRLLICWLRFNARDPPVDALFQNI